MLLFYASLLSYFFFFYLCFGWLFYYGLLDLLLDDSSHHGIRQRGWIVLLHAGGPFGELVYGSLALYISSPVPRRTSILLFPLVERWLTRLVSTEGRARRSIHWLWDYIICCHMLVLLWVLKSAAVTAETVDFGEDAVELISLAYVFWVATSDLIRPRLIANCSRFWTGSSVRIVD